MGSIDIFTVAVLPIRLSGKLIQQLRLSVIDLRSGEKFRSNSSDSLVEILIPKYVMWFVHNGIGEIWAATSQLFGCSGRMDDFSQLME